MYRSATLKLGEFFCGPGGFALGASLASVVVNERAFSIRHAWATDYDQDSCDTYVANICPDKPHSVLCEDIRQLDFNRLRAISDIDIFSFGFPCNDYSVVGERKGIHGDFGPLYAYGINALKFFQPKFFIAENVGGLKAANNGDTFAKILREMHQAGYSVHPHYYKFEQYGVPQTRHRIIIVGVRDNICHSALLSQEGNQQCKLNKSATLH